MEITEQKTADIVTLSLSGKLDTTAAKPFEEKILTRIESGDRRFIINLAHLEYIGSQGLRVFLLAAKRLDSANGKLVLCGFKKTIPYHTLNRPQDPCWFLVTCPLPRIPGCVVSMVGTRLICYRP